MKPRSQRSPAAAAGPFLVAFLSLLGSGCAGIPSRLEPAVASRVESAKVQSWVAQDQLAIKVMASTYGSGLGLIGAIVDSGVTKGRASDAERRVAPLRKEVPDVDVRARLWEKLVPAVKSVEWPRVVEVETVSAPAVVKPEHVRGSAFVSLATSYDLSPNASVFEMHSHYTLYVAGSTAPAAIGSVSYWSRLIGKGPDGKAKEDEEAIALWSAEGGASYRAAVDEGIAEIIRMLGIALPYVGGKEAGGPAEAAEIKVDVTHGRGDFGLKTSRTTYRGTVLERGPERLVFRASPGWILSIPAADIEERRLP